MTNMGPSMIRDLFDRLRHDPKHHNSLGDIRLTIAQQDEIADEVDRLRASKAQLLHAMRLAVAELRAMHTEHYPGCGVGCSTLECIDLAEDAIAAATA